MASCELLNSRHSLSLLVNAEKLKTKSVLAVEMWKLRRGAFINYSNSKLSPGVDGSPSDHVPAMNYSSRIDCIVNFDFYNFVQAKILWQRDVHALKPVCANIFIRGNGRWLIYLQGKQADVCRICGIFDVHCVQLDVKPMIHESSKGQRDK